MNPGTSAMPATIISARACPTSPASSPIHGSATATDSANQPMLAASAIANLMRTPTYSGELDVRSSPEATIRS